MNNFTMDELTDLLFCVKDHTGYQGDSIHENLIKKIQPMIENYCEHEWRCWDDIHNSRECIKCGEERQGEIT